MPQPGCIYRTTYSVHCAVSHNRHYSFKTIDHCWYAKIGSLFIFFDSGGDFLELLISAFLDTMTITVQY